MSGGSPSYIQMAPPDVFKVAGVALEDTFDEQSPPEVPLRDWWKI